MPCTITLEGLFQGCNSPLNSGTRISYKVYMVTSYISSQGVTLAQKVVVEPAGNNGVVVINTQNLASRAYRMRLQITVSATMCTTCSETQTCSRSSNQFYTYAAQGVLYYDQDVPGGQSTIILSNTAFVYDPKLQSNCGCAIPTT